MFRFKEKSILKYYKKTLELYDATPREFNSEKIKSIGVLVEESQFFQNRILIDLQQNLQIDSKNITLMVYRPYTKKHSYSFNEFSEKDFGWSGSLKLNKLQEFVKNDYDLFINYGLEGNMYLKIITLQSQSKFKVGFSSEDNRLYDLSVVDKSNNISVLNAETAKYLKILNKL